MSVQLIAWAYQQTVGSPTEKAVLLALANTANHHTGQCNPSVNRIVDETEFGESTVRKALTSLEEKGFIEKMQVRRDDGSYSSNTYRFPHLLAASTPSLPDSDGPSLSPRGHEPEVNLEPLGPTTSVVSTPSVVGANEIVAAYIDYERASGYEPPRRTIGMIARHVGELLKEGQSPESVVAALRLMSERRLHPATLPTLIAEAVKGPPAARKPKSQLDLDYERLTGETL